MDRSALFRMALYSAKLSTGAFINSYLDRPASESMIYAVAAGRKTSARISAAIDKLIADQRPRMRLAIESPLRQAA